MRKYLLIILNEDDDLLDVKIFNTLEDASTAREIIYLFSNTSQAYFAYVEIAQEKYKFYWAGLEGTLNSETLAAICRVVKERLALEYR